MVRLTQIMKPICLILLASVLSLCWATSYSWAGMVGTDEALIKKDFPRVDRTALFKVLQRKDVQEKLEQYGIPVVEAMERVNSLTDEEIAVITEKIKILPEGRGYNMSGVIFFPGTGKGAILVTQGAILITYYLVAAALDVSIYMPIVASVCFFPGDHYAECFKNNHTVYWKRINQIRKNGFGSSSRKVNYELNPYIQCTSLPYQENLACTRTIIRKGQGSPADGTCSPLAYSEYHDCLNAH